MKIFSICCVRDENDIVGETLKAALEWSDRIFVFDNGSVDGTWETLQDLANCYPKIELVGHDDRTFTDELRGEIFETRRHVASPGDWWCRLDSDEFFIDDPAQFLGNVPQSYGFVLSATMNFYFTDADLKNYEENPAEWLARPVQERLRYYQNNWSEPRFVRHRGDLRWGGLIWPHNRGRTSPSRIRLKHFPYRSPTQISKRLAIRQQQPGLFKHEANRALAKGLQPDWTEKGPMPLHELASWRDRVREAAECDVDRGDGMFFTRDDLMPPLPSPALDLVKVGLRRTQVGRAIVSPLLRWRRSQFGRR